VRFQPAGNQAFLSPGDIVNFKQERFLYIVGEGNKTQPLVTYVVMKMASKSTTLKFD